jgi:2-dehydropantoate 2-reductase
MKILVVGAGAIGGYFGGRLLNAGRDVTFLVRAKRAAQLAQTGLVIKSRLGDAALNAPPTVLAEDLRASFDLVLLSCKAYDLDAAIDSFAPAVGPQTAILPLLNGMRHLDVLDRRFGAHRVLGGECVIAATLDDAGRVMHLNDTHLLAFGERASPASSRTEAIAAAMQAANFASRVSADILLEMWEKWVFLSTLAGITCLMRASVGDIVAAGGAPLALALLEECRAVAASAGYAPRAAALEQARANLTATGSTLTASMARDIERGAKIEADHVLGDMLRRGSGTIDMERSILRLAYTHAKAYETRLAGGRQ